MNLDVANEAREEDLLYDVTLQRAERGQAQQQLGEPVPVLYSKVHTVQRMGKG